MFAAGDGDGPAKWWLWVFIGPDTVCFVMDPSRSGAVLARHAGIDQETGQLTAGEDGGPRSLVISSDFYKVYESAGKKADGLVNLYCLAHVRRHFIRAGNANPVQLKYWTDAWQERIRDLYRAQHELGAAWQGRTPPRPRPQRKQAAAARLEKAYEAWDDALTVIDEARKKQMAARAWPNPRRRRSPPPWTANGPHHREPRLPMVSLDNNLAECQIRGPVVTRKNASGSHKRGTPLRTLQSSSASTPPPRWPA